MLSVADENPVTKQQLYSFEAWTFDVFRVITHEYRPQRVRIVDEIDQPPARAQHADDVAVFVAKPSQVGERVCIGAKLDRLIWPGRPSKRGRRHFPVRMEPLRLPVG